MWHSAFSLVFAIYFKPISGIIEESSLMPNPAAILFRTVNLHERNGTIDAFECLHGLHSNYR